MPRAGSHSVERLPGDVGVAPAAGEPADVDERGDARAGQPGAEAGRGPAGPCPTVSSGIAPAYPGAASRAPVMLGHDVGGVSRGNRGEAGRRCGGRAAMQALVGVTVLGLRQLLPHAGVAARLRGHRGRAARAPPASSPPSSSVVTIAVQADRPGAHGPLRCRPGARRRAGGAWARRRRSTRSTTAWSGSPRCRRSGARGSPSSPCSGATLAAQVAPPERRGESIGLYGLAIAVPNLIAVPAGRGAGARRARRAGWPGWRPPRCSASFLVPLLVRSRRRRSRGRARPGPAGPRCSPRWPPSARAVRRHPGRRRAGHLPAHRAAGRRARDRRPAAVRRSPARSPAGGPGCSPTGSAAGGCCRWRWSSAAVGLVARPPSGWSPATPGCCVGAAVFGAGYGAVQNLTLLAAFARAGEGGTTTASAMWNVSFDAGTATGALALGLPRRGDRAGLDLRAWSRRCSRRRCRWPRPPPGPPSAPERRPATRSATSCWERMSRISSPARRSQVPQALGVAAVGVAELARAAAAGCWPGRAAPAGRTRASARATAVRPAPRNTRSRTSVRPSSRRSAASSSAVSRVRNSSARRRPSAADRGRSPHHCARRGGRRRAGSTARTGDAAGQASRRRKDEPADQQHDGHLAGEHREADPRVEQRSG